VAVQNGSLLSTLDVPGRSYVGSSVSWAPRAETRGLLTPPLLLSDGFLDHDKERESFRPIYNTPIPTITSPPASSRMCDPGPVNSPITFLRESFLPDVCGIPSRSPHQEHRGMDVSTPPPKTSPLRPLRRPYAHPSLVAFQLSRDAARALVRVDVGRALRSCPFSRTLFELYFFTDTGLEIEKSFSFPEVRRPPPFFRDRLETF